MHRPSSEQMQVEMFDRLSPIGPGVNDDSIAATEVLAARDLRDKSEQVTEELFVVLSGAHFD